LRERSSRLAAPGYVLRSEDAVKRSHGGFPFFHSGIKVANQDRGVRIGERELRYAVRLATEGEEKPLDEVFSDVIVQTHRGKQIRTKTAGQKTYVDAIRRSGVTFGIGPAGTGKTYLAMAVAIAAFKNKEVNRIILTRPAVEAGEKLGFLPGDMQQKVDPYLRPLYDALWDIMGVDSFEKYMEKGQIEVAPLAFMRGRTLDDSFIILDEAQNTTPEQMKMFLTRFGVGAKMIVTGDITQIDLPHGQHSGLVNVAAVLSKIPDIAFVYFDNQDVVRHKLVQDIVSAYKIYAESPLAAGRTTGRRPGERRRGGRREAAASE
jgi:phosphate starvation-inducible PhoH-like protein